MSSIGLPNDDYNRDLSQYFAWQPLLRVTQVYVTGHLALAFSPYGQPGFNTQWWSAYIKNTKKENTVSYATVRASTITKPLWFFFPRVGRSKWNDGEHWGDAGAALLLVTSGTQQRCFGLRCRDRVQHRRSSGIVHCMARRYSLNNRKTNTMGFSC